MQRGSWHQCGDRSQKLVIEQLQNGAGVGVIISPRDVAQHKAIEYAKKYHDNGAHVLIDQQFYIPSFSNSKLESYSTNQYRQTVSKLHQITHSDLEGLKRELHRINHDLLVEGIIAPAVVYEAGRAEIIQLNERLFKAAQQVGNNLGIPTYATVVIGKSAISSKSTIDTILAHATSLNSDGWYYSFEFNDERIPSPQNEIYRCCEAGLTLACTGKPVLHAYAGPLGLLSFGFGATGAAIGHSQNIWKFTRERWQDSPGGGGGGDAPARLFSTTLWGTVIHPDEVVSFSKEFQALVLTPSPFYSLSTARISRWEANKHLVYVICSTINNIATNNKPRDCATEIIALLQNACNLHEHIAKSGIELRDNTNVYQKNWQLAMQDLLSKHSDDFDYLDLLLKSTSS